MLTGILSLTHCGLIYDNCQGGPITTAWLVSHYAYIGTMEQFSASLADLEARLPHFFHGVVQLYRELKEKRENVTPRDQHHVTLHNIPRDMRVWLDGVCLAESVFYSFVNRSFRRGVRL